MGNFTTVEERGRVLIPKSLREELNLKPGQKLLIEREGRKIVLKPMIDIKKFAMELRGCVKRLKVKPEEVKSIWGRR